MNNSLSAFTIVTALLLDYFGPGGGGMRNGGFLYYYVVYDYAVRFCSFA
jgi:hypothetical protein